MRKIMKYWLLGFLLLVSACNRPDRNLPDQVRYAAQFARAQIAFDKGDYGKAIAMYTEIIKIAPDNAVAYAKRGYALYKSNQDQQAVEDFNKAIELKPEYADAYAWRGLAYAFLHQPQQAIHDCRKALERDPENVEAYLGLGGTYALEKQYQQAIENYTQAIALNPDEARAYSDRGFAYKDSGDYQTALADYNTALELAPNARTYDSRGLLYTSLGHYDQAIVDFNQAIELEPQYAFGYSDLGMAYASLWNFKEAEAQCQKSLQLDEKNCDAHYCLGIVYQEMGGADNYLKAVEHYQQAIDLACNEFEMEIDVANVYVKIGMTKALSHASSEAIRAAYQEAIRRTPWHTYAYILMGEQSEGEQAIAYYSKAIELDPDYAVPYVKRGLIYTQQGKSQKAAADFERAKERALDSKWRDTAEVQLRLLREKTP